MSEIASKPNTGNGSSLAQPFAKKDAPTEHDVMFAALFGGVVAVETNSDPVVDALSPVHDISGVDVDANVDSDSGTDILTAMQVVAAMLSGQRSKDLRSHQDAGRIGPNKVDSTKDEPLNISVLEDDMIDINELKEEPLSNGAWLDEEDLLNPAIIGPMPLHQQPDKSLTSSQSYSAHAKMAFEDHEWRMQNGTNQTTTSAKIKNRHLADTVQLEPESINEMQDNHQKIDNIQRRTVTLAPSSLRNSYPAAQQMHTDINKPVVVSERAIAEMNGDIGMQFDGPDEHVRALTGQMASRTERAINRQIAEVTSGDTAPTNAARLALAAGSAAGGQMTQQNNGQSAWQPGGSTSIGSGMTNGNMMDILDMAQDNWTEMLLKRVEKGLSGGKDQIDLHLNPRNLGKIRITLIIQNDRANVHIQTESNAAAQALSESETRLAQMMDASGMKFGSLTSQHNQNFSGKDSKQDQKQGTANLADAGNLDGKDNKNAEISVEQPENLINIQA